MNLKIVLSSDINTSYVMLK